MNCISITYTLILELDFAPNYKWTKCGKCFNSKTTKQIKQVYNNVVLDIILMDHSNR